jgi:ornithine--oxo-acid transaminase
LRKRLEELSRRQSGSKQSGQGQGERTADNSADEALNQVENALQSMESSSSGGEGAQSSGSQQPGSQRTAQSAESQRNAQRASRSLNEALRQMERRQRQGMAGTFDELANRAKQLAEEQRRTEEEMQSLFSQGRPSGGVSESEQGGWRQQQGAEAVETALKFARYATGRPRVLYCDHAFHGLTTGSLSVNGENGFRDGFAPLLPDTAVPLGDLDALARELRKGDVAALIVEPIQGKGVHEAPPGYLRAAQELLHGHRALLILDEVQTGLGRTGDFYAYQHEEGVEPDLVCVAKALSGGYVPVGATLGKEWIFKKVYSSMDRVLVHSASFGSNAQAMAAGLAVLSVMENEEIVANARATGELLKSRLAALVDTYELLSEVRGRGLMIGIEFGRPRSLKLRGRWTMLQAARKGLFAQMVVVPLLQRHRILTQVSGDHLEVIKLIPPLIIGEREVDRFVAAFTEVMDDAHSGGGLMWDFGKTLVKQAVANR